MPWFLNPHWQQLRYRLILAQQRLNEGNNTVTKLWVYLESRNILICLDSAAGGLDEKVLLLTKNDKCLLTQVFAGLLGID